MYYYEGCQCHVVNVIHRYKINLRMMDNTDNATLQMSDCDACFILQKSCSHLLECIQKPDITVGLSLGDTSLNIEFQDVQCFIVKDLMQHFSDGDICHGSQAENTIPNLTPTKKRF